MKTLIAPRRTLRPTNYNYAMSKLMNPLSEKEEVLKEAFRFVNTDSLWGEAIRNLFIDYTDTKFRELAAELMSQCDDNAEIMYQILGKDCYDALNAIKPKL